jgi:hypothetical protein
LIFIILSLSQKQAYEFEPEERPPMIRVLMNETEQLDALFFVALQGKHRS